MSLYIHYAELLGWTEIQQSFDQVLEFVGEETSRVVLSVPLPKQVSISLSQSFVVKIVWLSDLKW